MKATKNVLIIKKVKLFSLSRAIETYYLIT